MRGVNVWSELVEELYAKARECANKLKNQDHNTIAYQNALSQLRFAAHLAIVLQLHDRIDF